MGTLNQTEFEYLMKMKKIIVNDNYTFEIPISNSKKTRLLVKSCSSSDNFYLDINNSGKIELSKFKYQNLHVNSTTPLVRLEINAPEHINPDGKKISRNHIHIYREKYDMAYAYDLSEFDSELFTTLSADSLFKDFCKFCNIDYNKPIQGVINND